ncbi:MULTISPECIES: META domain-containing protein [Acinetobacter]|uniref:META domain-containing protein n=1 Tax=Acinetobacter piscicola TaxID=2006115 RepID=A0A4Q4H1Z0_9GAMM|nr:MULTISPECIES: META domain-containing protein [Acinetobacter]MDM1756031.1 META domain-containing protein [Acinetobacter sp. 256-1]MDM1760527.1 META domain-containing protein [Acinetobacter sp. 251-1]QOW45453.1 META domain-containing protein [Acinetobacter piscicola]RYL28497.1 META domain-containing protein [Acinetobacter piscicola]
MLKSVLISSCAVLTLSMAGCATMSNPSTERNLNDLQNKNWVVSELYGTKLAADPTQSDVPSIQFNNERVSGSDGCNRFMGGYAVKGTQIQFSNLASTQRACLNATDIPQKYTQALGQVTHYDASKKELKFLDANNKVVIKFDHVK